MNSKLKKSTVLSLILGVISFLWLIYNLIAFEILRPKTIMFTEIGKKLEILVLFMDISIFVFLIFHLSAIITLILRIKTFKRTGFFLSIVLFTGIISSILVLGDLGLLSDIGKEFKLGLDVSGEWTALYVCHFIHLLFVILMFVMNISTLQIIRHNINPETVIKDEVVFITAQYVGIFCGLLGIVSVFVYSRLDIPFWIFKRLVITFSVIIFLPYCFIAAYWLMIKLKEDIKQWYDEKQFSDISKSALFTLLASIPALTVMFIIYYFNFNTQIYLLWFPFYVFLILFLFSGSTLYLFKRE